MVRIAAMMEAIQTGKPPIANTKTVTDYSVPVAAEPGVRVLPSSNVLKYILNGSSWLVLRLSGMGPKIKIYYSVKGGNQAAAVKRLDEIRSTMKIKLGVVSSNL